MSIASPGKDAALGEQAPVHLLPAVAVMLHDGLVGYSKGAARGKAPICRVESYRGLLERGAGAAEGEEAFRVQVRKDKHEDIQRKLSNGRGFVRHGVEWKLLRMLCHEKEAEGTDIHSSLIYEQ